MLHVETVSPDTLALLKRIQDLPILAETRLVGGTALALQLGHRRSIDLDFFGSWGESNLQSELETCGTVVRTGDWGQGKRTVGGGQRSGLTRSRERPRKYALLPRPSQAP